ncbi:pyridoxal-phosphate dependent enzyme [Bacteroidota bacterium]
MEDKIPRFSDIQKAHERIADFIHRTPVFTCQSINKIYKAKLFFKCENFQKVGAFKFRGATNAILSLNESQCKYGVATHSSGNHAQALSLAARKRNIKAYIVMPVNSKKAKIEAVQTYGGQITFCEPTLDSREKTCEKIVEMTGAAFIHSYNKFEIICGQGTAAKELIEEINDLNAVIAPVGGGGLLSGTSLATKGMNNDIKVYGAEPKMADDAYRSFKSGKFVPSVDPKTIADGLLTSLGSLTFEIILKNVDDIFTVKEESIIDCMRLIWERMKIIVEPSAAVPLAVIHENQEVFKNKRIGIILSGGNLDLSNLPF